MHYVYFLFLSLSEGRIASPKSTIDKATASFGKITRKRNQIESNDLSLQIYDEFGRHSDDDEIAWSQIFGQTSFIYDHCVVEVDSDVVCYLADEPSISCERYMEMIGFDDSRQCEVQVVYEFIVRNIGSETDKIVKIKTAIDSVRPFSYIENSIQSSLRTLTPGHFLTATQEGPLNFCLFNKDVKFEVGIECAEGGAKMFYPSVAFKNASSSCNAKIDLSCKSSNGGLCIPIQQSTSSACDFRPPYIDFSFTGGLCAASANDKIHHFSCNEKGKLTEVSKAFIIVQDKGGRLYFSDYVNKGATFRVDHGQKRDSTIWVSIYDTDGGAILQTFNFHSSCSEKLALNDIFGGITIGKCAVHQI